MAEDTPTPTLENPPESTLSSSDPKTISNRYVVIDRLGEGGMGKVYLAHDPVIARDVAIKMLRFDSSSSQLVTRFQQEARAVARLDHPGIVKALDFGLTKEQDPYFVMEFVQGKTLNTILDEDGKLELDEFYEIFLQITEAMSHAHQNGIVHRDLKPSNILIQEDEEEIRAFVLDFGVVKIAYDTDPQILTHTGQMIGSPRYASPEQITGDRLDARSDIYALGCVMYEALTAAPPFRSENQLEVVRQHVKEPAPSLADSGGQFPKSLERLIATTLEKDPDKRFQTMEELAELLLGEDLEQEREEKEETVEDRNSFSIGWPLSLIGILLAIMAVSVATLLKAPVQEKRAQSKKPETHQSILQVTPEEGEFIEQLPDRWQHGLQDNLKILKNGFNTDRLILTGLTAVKDSTLIKLPQITSLEKLDLSKTGVTGEGMELIASQPSIKLLRLNHLKLSGSLAPLGKMPRLSQLFLKGCHLDNEDIRTISSIKKLTFLSLSENPKITDDALPYLRGLPRLMQLELVGTSVTAAGVEKHLKGMERLSKIQAYFEDDDVRRIKSTTGIEVFF